MSEGCVVGWGVEDGEEIGGVLDGRLVFGDVEELWIGFVIGEVVE